MAWSKILIDVDYQPADPGRRDHYCERTELLIKDLKVGQGLVYNDPSNILPSIKLVGIDKKGVTLQSDNMTVRLPDFKGNLFSKLAEAGRDYTSFQLWVGVVEAIDITHDLNFLRHFNKNSQILSLTSADVEVLSSSDDPYAMYGYASWLAANNRDANDINKALDLYAKAAEGGCPDALMGESLLWSSGIGGLVDLTIAADLRDEAVAKGSEFAAMCQARNRIAGFNANKEPEKVLEEIKQRMTIDNDFNPRWYSVMAFAYETMDDLDNAKRLYQKAIENNAEDAYIYLAYIYKNEGDADSYRKLMLEGIERGCALCCTLDAEMDEDAYRELSPTKQNNLKREIGKRLKRGIQLGEGICAYYLAFNYFHGTLGFKRDIKKAFKYANEGYRLGDAFACDLIIDMQNDETPEDFKFDDSQTAFMRLEALRFGDDSQLEAVVKAYHAGLYSQEAIQEEIRREWLPKYVKPLPKLVKDEMEPTVLIIHPDAYTEYLEADLSKFGIWDPFKEIAHLIDAEDARDVSVAQPLRDITKAADLEEGRHVAMFYDIDAEKKGLKVNPVATKLSGGKEIRGSVVIALEGEFVPMDCNDSGYRPYYSFTFVDDIEAVFDEIYDLMDSRLYTDDDLEDDDGRFDPYV
ncbi:MAG: sel1 repeat family protein [Bacteroidales bacterium]|nr:sel1 repeat family protein [Bacteroidales bacterium]